MVEAVAVVATATTTTAKVAAAAVTTAAPAKADAAEAAVVEAADAVDPTANKTTARIAAPNSSRTKTASSLPLVAGSGVLEMHPNGYGFLRNPATNFTRERTDPVRARHDDREVPASAKAS